MASSLDNPRELILILDFGAQYTQLIARRVRECQVFCEMFLIIFLLRRFGRKIHADLFYPAVLPAYTRPMRPLQIKRYMNSACRFSVSVMGSS